MLVNTKEIDEYVNTVGRLNTALSEVQSTLAALESGEGQFEIDLRRHHVYHSIHKLNVVNRKELDTVIRYIIIGHLKDKEKFVESELQTLLSKQLEGGNE